MSSPEIPDSFLIPEEDRPKIPIPYGDETLTLTWENTRIRRFYDNEGLNDYILHDHTLITEEGVDAKRFVIVGDSFRSIIKQLIDKHFMVSYNPVPTKYDIDLLARVSVMDLPTTEDNIPSEELV